MGGALFRAALVASCFRGALPPVDLRAVCLVRAILIQRSVARSICLEVQIRVWSSWRWSVDLVQRTNNILVKVHMVLMLDSLVRVPRRVA